MSLDTLQELILAAHAEGDGELASWLGDAADDPDLLAQLTTKPAGDTEHFDPLESLLESEDRWLLEHGFTGTITDAAGRKQQYTDGKHVAGQQAATGGAGAHTGEEIAIPPAEAGRFAKVRAKVEAKLKATKGGRAVLALGKGGAWLFHKIERPLLYAMHKTEEVAVAAAKERGLSDEAAAKLKHALFTADFIGGYATGAAGLAVAGVVGAKVGSIMPSASVAYLLYSTARNPAATWRAAKSIVAETFARRTRATTESEESLAPLAATLAEYIDRAGVDSDWFVAVFIAAMAHTEGNTEDALELAAEVIEAMPDSPAARTT